MTDASPAPASQGEGATSTYLVFKPYPLQPGQRIFIESGPRRGDWEVVGLSDRKVRLRCPFSGREVEWDRFYAMVEERSDHWPHPD